MPPEKRDLDEIFAQPFPPFLELLKTNPAAGLAEFASCARPWLLSHPTPSMRTLTASEQQDVVEETIRRCVQKDGEPLRNYTDMWENFGDWLSTVADRTCEAKFRKRGRTASETGGLRAAHPARKPPEQTPLRPATARSEPAAGGVRRRKLPKEERPARAMYAFFGWLRSPRVFVPVLIVLAVAVVRGIRPDVRQPRSRSARTITIQAELVPESDTKNIYYDILDIPLSPPGDDQAVRAITTIFREDRLVVLRLERRASEESGTAYGVSIRNKGGETVWSAALAPEIVEDEFLYLRIDPTTFPPEDYQLHIVDTADVPMAAATFMIR